MAALDALERGDRRKGATYLRSAIRAVTRRRSLNPRMAVGAVGVLAGRATARARWRARAAPRARRSWRTKPAYEKA